MSSLSNTVLEEPEVTTQKKKEIKGMQIWEEEIKLSLLEDCMILYVENQKNSQKYYL
jgi:hypothetical protein